MKAIDFSLFDQEKLVIKSLNQREYKIRKSISVKLCINLFNAMAQLEIYSRDSKEYRDILEDIVCEFITQEDSKYQKEDFDSLEAQENLFLFIYSQFAELVNNPVLNLPDININQKNDRYSKNSDEFEFMEGITYVMRKTSNSYTEIMNMPYVCYLSILKHLKLSEYMQNEEYREAYYKQMRKDNRNKNKRQSIDLKGLKNFNI